MKISFTLFLTAMVAITMEICRAEYLLVAVDDDDFRKTNDDDVREEGTKLEGETCGPCFNSVGTCGTCVKGLECVPHENVDLIPDLSSRCRAPQKTNSETMSNRWPKWCIEKAKQAKEQMGNQALGYAGKKLGISEVTDCESAAKYVTKKLKSTLSKACDSTITEMLDIVSEDEELKDRIKNKMRNVPVIGDEPNTAKVKKYCPCTCPQG